MDPCYSPLTEEWTLSTIKERRGLPGIFQQLQEFQELFVQGNQRIGLEQLTWRERFRQIGLLPLDDHTAVQVNSSLFTMNHMYKSQVLSICSVELL
jgi:hypothetical protein